ncbi:hypothetical protein [Deinococcus metallilatus]|uniref:HEPN domain-containing protein n=1 Tax=Deinococcus metallilatus TaxID=1211322 RepID=A0ABR6MSM9_9DEIO|nr:hypothetical protein [Deinococcus metallilatus]MBB5294935.1 hypothetical protein [Deinococcus metallilatus]GMA16865.1 hypothetical protein GCM10025871_31960 [Deinococcus metallilatus]
MPDDMFEQEVLSAVEAAWRRAAFRCARKIEPWAFLKMFRAELALELAERRLERSGYLL